MSQDEAVARSKKNALRFFLVVAAIALLWYISAMGNLNNKVTARIEQEKATLIQVMEKRYGPITKEIADKAETDAREYYAAYYERLDKMNKMGNPQAITDPTKQEEYVLLRRGADNMALQYNLILEKKDYYWGGRAPSGLPDELPKLYGNATN